MKHPVQPDSLADAAVLTSARSSKDERVGSASDRSHSFSPFNSAQTNLLDQAYQDYCTRCDAGEQVDPDDYCAQYPGFQSSLGRLLQAHRYLENNLALTGAEEVHWPEVGDTFLDYQLVMQLGQGAFARVFLAMELKLGNRLVALKIAEGGAATEADILGRSSHPNIVPVYSTGRDRATGLTVVCMPYVGSATLHDVLDRLKAGNKMPARARVILEASRDLRHPVDPSAQPSVPPRILERGTYLDGVRWLGVQLADALAYLHERHICHLDLKPSNVLLSPAGAPMLLDFNLSSDALQDHVPQGGTIPYMSPEQLEAVVGAASTAPRAASDLFSLGVILYELVTGSHPFGPIPIKASTRELGLSLLERQRAGFVPVRRRNPDVDAALARLIESCISCDIGRRPDSARSLAATLRRSLTPTAQVGRWIGGNPKKTLTVMFACLAIAGTAVALAAVRPPFGERNYAAGILAFQKGNHEEAINRFDAAIDADPESATAAAAYFARGRVYQQWGRIDATKYYLAARDFDRAEKLAPDGRNLAAIGYCETCIPGGSGAAIEHYKRAQKVGFANAELYNNLGFCYMNTGKPKEARKCLDQAIELKPGLQAAYYNRALIQMMDAKNQSALLKHPTASAAFSPDEQKKMADDLAAALRLGLADFQKAVELGPQSGELSFDAACFYATASVGDSGWKEHALQLLTKAVKEQQFNPKRLATEPLLEDLRTEKRFQVLTTHPAPNQPMQRAIRVVDPTSSTTP